MSDKIPKWMAIGPKGEEVNLQQPILVAKRLK